MSLLKLSRISLLTCMRRLSSSLMTRSCQPSMLIARSLSSTSRSEWNSSKLGEELEAKIREASRLEQQKNQGSPQWRWKYFAFFALAIGLFTLVADLYVRRMLSKTIAKLEELKNYAVSLNDEVHHMVESELTANPVVKEMLGGSINLSKEGKPGPVRPIFNPKMTAQTFETSVNEQTNEHFEGWKQASIDNKLELLGYSLFLVYLVAGTKNSAQVVATLKMPQNSKEVRLESISLRLNTASNNNLLGIMIKTNDKLVPSTENKS